ncbi:uncharacterized protein DSM5745_04326 [Aspergillus mulundensis]|uniref:Uncharacterized protein n=1 Tax=Aspergillus mulundensis TaxID=1810919 RepID=A0A3D8SCD0_9EURO|nr:Uncharacterized protein DSM5745_04326 [Aspergillus mulundensis]RDW84000.1 Uncharacterized protein DSM5745_04326 [Aspergillus mulundensis]
MATKRDPFSAYSDASSSYWPPGWNFARFASATPADNATLSEEERANMQAGLRDVLGEEGVAELARVMWQEQLRAMRAEKEKKAVAAGTHAQRRVPPPPAWLEAWKKMYKDSGKRWGFVCVWTDAAVSAAEGKAGPGSGGVEEFQDRVREIAEIPFKAALEQGQPAELIEDARKTFEIRWAQLDDNKEKDMGNTNLVERLRARYHSMQEPGSIQQGLALPVFLVVSPSAVASVLSTSEEKPEATSSGRRSEAPFLLAVAAEEEQDVVDDDEEANVPVGRRADKDSFKPVFRVAVEVLVGELWPVVEEQITTLDKMTTYVQGADVTEHALPIHDDEECEGAGQDEDALDAIWWSMHPPPHRMRKRRRLFGSG